MITTFTDTDEKTYTFQEYLKSRGLFASRFHVYLMSTFVRDGVEGSANGADRKTQITGDFEHLMATNVSTTEENQSVLLVLKNQLGKSPFPDQTVSGNKLHITYESVTNSSFSDVVMRVMSFSRARCYDVYSFQDPIIQDMPLTDFDQLDCGFNVVDISKGEKVFLQRGDDP
ncbi:hypothetical protein pdam_00025761, partial [Pocillopora damicornis]